MKSINVYGTGENAFRFIMNNRCRKDVQIMNVISSDDDERKDFCGISIIKVSNAGDIMRRFFTVVASSEMVYWQIKEKLIEVHSLMEFENFVYHENFERKIAVIYGNCHTGPIKAMLKRSQEFSSLYGFYPLPQIQEIKKAGNISKYLRDIIGRCQLFIHQCIWEKNFYGKEYSSNEIIRYLQLESSKSRIIGIPNLYRMPQFMFPQMEYGDVMHEGRYGFQFRDNFIDNNYNVMTVTEMGRAIREDYQMFDKSFILDNYNKFYEKLLNREKEWDIPISDYIKDNISNVQLFFDPNHPTNSLLYEIVNELLLCLSIKNHPMLMERIYQLDDFEIPVYGCVKNVLDFKFEQYELRRTGIKLSDVFMDINEYVRQYCCWHKLEYKVGD